MDANNGGVDHLHLAIMGFGDGVHEAVPHTCFPPSDEAVVTGGAWSTPLGQVAPWRTRSQHPENAVQHPPVINTRHLSRLVGQQRVDHAPLEIGQVISAHAVGESETGAI